MVRRRDLCRASLARRGAGRHRRGEVAARTTRRSQLDGLLPSAAWLFAGFAAVVDRRGSLGFELASRGARVLSPRSAVSGAGAAAARARRTRIGIVAIAKRTINADAI